MSQEKQSIYEFGDFQLDIGKCVLLHNGKSISMQLKTFELLCALVKSNENLLTTDELMNTLWADTFVEENNLRQHIRALRKILGEGDSRKTGKSTSVLTGGTGDLPARPQKTLTDGEHRFGMFKVVLENALELLEASDLA